MNTKTLIGGISLIATAVVIAFVTKNNLTTTTAKQVPLITTASYVCMKSTTISASYYDSDIPSKLFSGEPPTPYGKVKLTLSDGRTFMLPQTISGSGARYADKKEATIFWNKGNSITFTENGQQTYKSCIAVAKDPGNLPQVYTSDLYGISLRYPVGYTVDESYNYQELGPDKTIEGVKFTIPARIATGTNLGIDSYISVEQIPENTACSANLFLDMAQSGTVETTTEGGVTYSVASSTGAGAGNRYEETIYALPRTTSCLAVRYFIHYGVIDNYPKTVKEFDGVALLREFDSIRKTLTIGQ